MSFFRLQSKSTKGFTLIEVMIALVILAVGLLALMALQIVSIKANAFSSEMTYSTMLAQQQLETLRNKGFSDADLTAGNHTLSPPLPPDAKGGSYTVSWQVVPDATTVMRTITVTVTWQSRRLGAAADQAAVTTTLQTILRQ
jgi:prepilin-type N-terminal cleavage/methylation domain-containing protein